MQQDTHKKKDELFLLCCYFWCVVAHGPAGGSQAAEAGGEITAKVEAEDKD